MLNLFVNTLLQIAGMALLIPASVLFIECLAAVLPRKHNPTRLKAARPKVTVVVPAHNEALGIARTLLALQSQLQGTDGILVVADNCSDETARIAEQAGAEVIERHDTVNRGKGFALRAALEALKTSPPDVVLFVDADCTPEPRCIEYLANVAMSAQGAVQACFIMPPPAKPHAGALISAFAVTVKNQVRPFGLNRLGLPCLLTGSGIAMPWTTAEKLPICGTNIVEDLQLSVDIAVLGKPAVFCADAVVVSALPSQSKAARSQRTRWEHGHLQTLLTETPRLFMAAFKARRPSLIAMALDLSVPPLSLLMMGWLILAALAIAYGMVAGNWLPAALTMTSGGLILSAMLFAWLKFGRNQLPLSAMVKIPAYMFSKIPIYCGFLFQRQRAWVRTERDSPAV